jgi:hypothetical protein
MPRAARHSSPLPSRDDCGSVGAMPAPRDDGARAEAVWASVALVLSVLASFAIALWGGIQYAFEGMTASANLATAVVVMSIAIGIPLAAIIAGGIRYRVFKRAGRPRRVFPLVIACFCLVLGLWSIGHVANSAKFAARDAELLSFQESLDVAAVEAEGVEHLGQLAAALELEVLGEPELLRKSCTLADKTAGVAPSVAIRAEVGGVPAAELVRVATEFWQGKGLEVSETGATMAVVSGEELEDPYVEILMIRDRFKTGPQLIYDAVCMKAVP